ncbi:MAG: WD40 repeat domain-containing protein, partial [Rhodanobacter sp.]
MNSIVDTAGGCATGPVLGTTPASPPPNPFVGPVPLDVGQQLHGRRRETEELSDLLVSKRVVLLFSPSGAGKTSLIRAGLIPRLKEAYEMEALPIVRLGHRDPACDCVASINRYRLATLLSLEKLREEGARRSARDLCAYTLKRYFEECVSAALGRDADGQPHYPLLILDQLEELFTADPLDVNQKREFLDELGNLLRGGVPGPWSGETGVPLWALFAIREDRLAELQPYLDLVPTALAFRYRLDALGVDAAREAIGETAGSDWMDAEVPQRLVDDLCTVSVRGADGRETFRPGRFVEPVQLQVVCRGLWEKIVSRQRRRIEAGDVQSCGNSEVDRALREFFDEEVGAAATDAGVSERKLREWIERRLISASGVRMQTLRDRALLGRNDDAITRLVDAHLLRSDAREGHEWIELPHDRLVTPVRAANEAWELEHLQSFQKQAKYWNQATGEHARHLLLAEDELATAKAWVRTHTEDLTSEEIEFLNASEQEIAQAALNNAREQKERTRRKRMAGIFAAVVLGLLATWATIEHEQKTQATERSTVYREAGSARELGWTGEALEAMLKLQVDAAAADAGLLLHFVNNAALRKRLPTAETGGVLSRFVDNTIRQQLVRSPAALVRELQPRNNVVWSLAFTGDGNRLLAGSWDGHLAVQDVAQDGAAVIESPDLRTTTYAVAINDAKGLVASTHGDGRALLWRLNGRELQRLAVLVPITNRARTQLTSAGFSGDGRWLAVAGWNKKVDVWDLADPGKPVHAASFRAADAPIESITFVPGTDEAGQQRLASTDYVGNVRLWSIGENMPEQPKPLREFSIRDHEGREVGISVSAVDPAGRYFVAGDTEGSVHLWDLALDDRTRNGILLGRATYGAGPQDTGVKGIAFAPKSNEFVSVGVDGYVVRWVLPTDAPDLTDLKKHVVAQRFKLGERLFSVAYRPHEPGQIAVGGTRSIVLLDLGRGPGPALSAPLPDSVGQTKWQTLSMDAQATHIAARDGDSSIRLWLRDAHGRIRAMPEWTLAQANASAFALSPDGQRVVTVDCHGWPTEWLLRTGSRPELVSAATAGAPGDCPGGPAARPSFSPDGRFLATANDNILRLWRRTGPGAGAWSESSSSSLLQTGVDDTSTPTRDPISVLTFSADSHYLAVGAGSGEVRLWSTDKGPGTSAFAPSAHVDVGRQVNALTFNVDGKTLLAGGDDGILTACAVPSLAVTHVFYRHEQSITGAFYAWPKGPGER